TTLNVDVLGSALPLTVKSFSIQDSLITSGGGRDKLALVLDGVDATAGDQISITLDNVVFAQSGLVAATPLQLDARLQFNDQSPFGGKLTLKQDSGKHELTMKISGAKFGILFDTRD